MEKGINLFIKLATNRFGDKFDYSKTIYFNDKTKVYIICPKHGEFSQQPRVHLSSKHGCPKCSVENKYLSFDDFLKRVKLVHGDRYEYEKGNYQKSTDKIKCFCKQHGYFYCRVNNLLSGKGCRICGREKITKSRRKTTEQFIEKAESVHGDKYDYNLVDYKNTHSKVKIVCKTHGKFFQTPANHLQGQGCAYCYKNKSIIQDTQGFIEESILVHNGKYSYDESVFNNLSGFVKIYCKKHGQFTQRASAHLRGAGCKKCGSEKVNKINTKTTEDYISKAKEIHKDRYDYSETVYNGYNKKVIIICKKHGQFTQTPEHHLRGCGCPNCANIKYKGYGGSKELKYFAEKLRSRTRVFIKNKNYVKKYETQETTGCTWVELKEHLENNPYGFKIDTHLIDLDHIIPLSTATNADEILKLNHYTNLQLLPREYNQHIKKNKKWDKDHFEKWLINNNNTIQDNENNKHNNRISRTYST